MKFSLALLLGVAVLFAPHASAAAVDTVVLFNPAALETPESIQFDRHGNLYGTTDPFNTVVRIAPDGTKTVLLTAADGLDGPTAAAFGVGNDNKNLYITNAAFPFFPGPNPRRPSILRHHVGIPGKPRP